MSVERMSRPPVLLVAAAALLVGGTLAASPSRRAPACTAAAIGALGVPDVTVTSARGVSPGPCVVLGTVHTQGFGAPDGSARFQLTLPAAWNQKFVQFGQGGFAGSLSASTNAGDPGAASAYASAVTDTGHTAGDTDARWALIAPGVPHEAKLTDYYFRAAHEVAAASKEIVRRYYGNAARRASFDGCSNGGPQAMVEATRIPHDFCRIISRHPLMDIRRTLAAPTFPQIQLALSDV